MTSEAPIATLLVANLDSDEEHAATEAGESLGPRPVVSVAARQRLSAAGTLLRCLARSSCDALWLPSPIALEQIAPLTLAMPRLVSGPLELSARAAGPFRQLVAWGETASIAKLRGELGVQSLAAEPVKAATPTTLAQKLRSLAATDPASARRANHRGYLLEIANRHGTALPGSCLIRSLDALAQHLAGGGADASPTQSWVLKAVHSAAGRARVFGSSAAVDSGQREAVTELLTHHGALLFEPWMPRLADFGASVLVAANAHELVSCHRQIVDRRGRFRGIEIPAGTGPGDPGLSVDERSQLETALDALARELRTIGYSGPVTVDSWRYQDAAGMRRFHAVGEINARLSVGVIARTLVDALRADGLLPNERAVRLCFSTKGAASARVIRPALPLFLPSPKNATSIWLEWEDVP